MLLHRIFSLSQFPKQFIFSYQGVNLSYLRKVFIHCLFFLIPRSIVTFRKLNFGTCDHFQVQVYDTFQSVGRPCASNVRYNHNEADLAKKAAISQQKQSSGSPTIFSKIIDGSISAKIIFRDDKCLVFHDVNPQAPTHFLVIPIKPISMLEKSGEEDKEVIDI